MKNNNLYIAIFAFFLIFTSCEKAVIGTAEVNDPENNFEIFWNDFDEHYALFDVRGMDWEEQYAKYRPQVTAQTTDQELWEIMTQMIAVLDDGHTFLLDRKTNGESKEQRGFFSSGSEHYEQVEAEFSKDLIHQKYVENITDITGDLEFAYGNIKNKNIGYIYLGGMDDADPARIDKVITDLKDYPAIILDIRNNGGGNDPFAARIASAFADKEAFVYTVQNRNGPNHTDFEAPRKFYTQIAKNGQYTKPVIILTDGYVASAAEIFLFHMKAFDQVVQMGDYTTGDFSDGGIRRFLPNGWEYSYSIQMFLAPDGKSLDGVGHQPDVSIRNTIADITAGNDKVLEHAFAYLLAEHNIE